MFNKYIAEYDAVFNNCQTWLVEYLKQINIAGGSCLSLPDKYLDGLTNWELFVCLNRQPEVHNIEVAQPQKSEKFKIPSHPHPVVNNMYMV